MKTTLKILIEKNITIEDLLLRDSTERILNFADACVKEAVEACIKSEGDKDKMNSVITQMAVRQ